ncbi:MAG: molybdopterin-binding protein [Bryobacteraceae bacterium]
MTDRLNLLGVEVVQKSIVGDDRKRLSAVISEALSRSELILLSGGLGPTEDDITRDAVASALEKELQFDPQIQQGIQERFLKMKRKMSENNKRQAFRIEGAIILPNDRGTAPGQWLAIGERIVVLLPGPPKELKAMWEQQCHHRLAEQLPTQVIATSFYRVAGMGESELDQLIAPIYSRYSNPVCTILAGPSDIQIHLRARCDSAEEAGKLLAELAEQIEPLWETGSIL